jgi:hypothetical protein
MKEPKTFRGKLLLLLRVAQMAAETDNEEEGLFFNSVIAAIQNELGDEEGQKILARYGLSWNG